MDREVLKYFNISKYKKEINLDKWNKFVKTSNNSKKIINIAIVGKYTNLADSYKSLVEAINHGSVANNVKVKIIWINSEKIISNNINKLFKNISAILVPGGFGERGIEGKIKSIKYSRENKIPFLGICLGMQMAIVEFGRNVIKLKDCYSSEFKNVKNPVIGLMTEWVKEGQIEKRNKSSDKGGTMRLGAYPCIVSKNSLAYKIYLKNKIEERHRHRYEVNTKYIEIYKKHEFIFSGLSPDKKLPEIFEFIKHPWFLGVQFHPELKSRPLNPHPIFVDFIKAAINKSKLL